MRTMSESADNFTPATSNLNDVNIWLVTVFDKSTFISSSSSFVIFKAFYAENIFAVEISVHRLY